MWKGQGPGKKKPEKHWAGLIWLNIIWQKKKIKGWNVGLGPCGWPKLPGKQIKNRLIYWVWPNNKWAELMGSTHVKCRIRPGWILCHISLPCWMPTWSGEAASDQNFGRRTNDLLQKVVNFSLRLPAFDLLFFGQKRSQMKNNDLSVANSEGHKLTYFL